MKIKGREIFWLITRLACIFSGSFFLYVLYFCELDYVPSKLVGRPWTWYWVYPLLIAIEVIFIFCLIKITRKKKHPVSFLQSTIQFIMSLIFLFFGIMVVSAVLIGQNRMIFPDSCEAPFEFTNRCYGFHSAEGFQPTLASGRPSHDFCQMFLSKFHENLSETKLECEFTTLQNWQQTDCGLYGIDSSWHCFSCESELKSGFLAFDSQCTKGLSFLGPHDKLIEWRSLFKDFD